MRNKSTQVVYELACKDKNVMALTADNRNEIYERIRQEMPRQYVDYGIAEENMVASAAGLASCGKIPFLYTVTNFMAMRAYEFIRNNICLDNLNVKFLGRSCGLTTGTWGVTHQGTEDLSLLRTLPNMVVISPATPIEAREATKWAYHHQGPVYIRLEGYNEPEVYDEDYIFVPNKGYIVHPGQDVTVIAMGSVINEALAATDELVAEGITLRVIDMPMVQPGDVRLITAAVRETRGIITLEEHSIHGGLGSAVAEVIAEQGLATHFHRSGLDGCARGCGNRQEMREINGVDRESVIRAVHDLL